MPRPHRPDQQRAGLLRPQLELADRGPRRTGGAVDRDFRHVAGAHDRESVQCGKDDLDGISGARARAHRERQLLADAQLRAIDACRDFGPLYEGQDSEQRQRHQSFTPAGAARRVRPVRSRRVRSSSCPIDCST